MADNALPRIADNTELSASIALDSSKILSSIQYSIDEMALSMMEFVEFQRSEAIRSKLAADNLADSLKGSDKSDSMSDKEGGSDNTFIFAELGILGAAAAALIGTTIGVIRGQIGVIKSFANAAKAFTPKFIMNIVAGVKTKLSNVIGIFTKSIDSIVDFLRTGIDVGVQRIASLFNFADDSALGRLAAAFKASFDALAKPFRAAIDLIRSAATSVKSISSGATGMFNVFSDMGGMIRGISKVVKTIFVPLGIIMSVIDTIKGAISGFEKDGVLGGIEGAITGLFNSIIGAPLDLIKNAVSWVLGIFGFDNAKSTLDSFSFSDLISDSIGAIFDMLESAVDWIGQLFTDPVSALNSLWEGIVGSGGLIDLLFKPIDSAIAWVKGLFGFETTEESWTLSGAVKGAFENAKAWLVDLFTFDASEGLLAGIATKFMDIVFAPYNLAIAWVEGIFGWGEPENPTKVSDIVMDAYNAIKDWFVEKFGSITDFLPSIDDIKTSLMNKLPSWLIPDSAKTPEMRAQEISNAIAEQQEMISKSESGENVYSWWQSEGSGREKSAAEMARLQAELDQVRTESGNSQAIIVNNNRTGDSINNSTSTSAPVIVTGGTDGIGMRPDSS